MEKKRKEKVEATVENGGPQSNQLVVGDEETPVGDVNHLFQRDPRHFGASGRRIRNCGTPRDRRVFKGVGGGKGLFFINGC